MAFIFFGRRHVSLFYSSLQRRLEELEVIDGSVDPMEDAILRIQNGKASEETLVQQGTSMGTRGQAVVML